MTSLRMKMRIALRRRLIDAAGIIVLAASYYALGRLSLIAAAAHNVVSSIWLPAGLAVFALVRFGLRFWPGVVIGAFALNATSGISPGGAAAIAFGNAVEALLGAYLLTRVAGMHRALDRVRDVLALAGLAGVLSTMLAAAIGVTSLVLTGASERATALPLWLVWWSGDAVGILIFAPLLFTWSAPEPARSRPALRGVESAITFATLVLGTDLLFRGWPGRVYFIFPLFTWIALRLGRRALATAVVIVTGIATWHTVSGVGPFTEFTPLSNLVSLQAYLALLTIPSLLFAAAHAEAQQNEAGLRQSEARYRALSSNLPDGSVVLFDRDLRLVLVEGPAVATAGFAKDEIAGRTVAEVFDPHDASMLEVPLRRAFVGEASEFEFPLRERTYLVRVLPLADSAGAVTLGMALALDITERHAAAREIADSRTRLQLLSRRLIAAHEEERRRVAREVHDDLGQALTGVKIGLGALMPRSSRRDTDDTERRILGVSQVVDGAIESVQRIILRLRPGVLDNLGPVAALEWEAQQFTRQTGVPVTLNLPGDPLAMDSESSTALYRTVQEALTNVARHAAASAVRIGLATTGEELVLHVTDDGCGIPDSEAHRPHSMGILGMRERAFACGGTLEVSRAAAGGTRLVLRLPHRTPEVNIDDH